jgi:phosphoribulokinase
MSARHPIISITGSSGAGTTSVKRIFEQIFRRENVEAAFIEGDAFHRYDRAAMKEKIADEERRGNPNFTHFNAQANELEILEEVFSEYGRKGTGRTRTYVTTRRRPPSSAPHRAPSPSGATSRRATCSSTKACTAAPSPTGWTSPSCPTSRSASCP